MMMSKQNAQKNIPILQTNLGMGKSIENKTFRNFYGSMIKHSRLTLLEGTSLHDTYLNSFGSKAKDFNLQQLIVVSPTGNVIINKSFSNRTDAFASFIKPISRICVNHTNSIKTAEHTENYKSHISNNNSSIPWKNLKGNQGVELKYASIIDEIKENSSELHPFTFHQSHSQSHFTNLNSNLYGSSYNAPSRNKSKFNISNRMFESSHASDMKVDPFLKINSTSKDNLCWFRKYLEVHLPNFKVVVFSHTGLSFAGIFDPKTSSKLCKVLLTHLLVTFTNCKFSDFLKGGLEQMTIEDALNSKIYEIVWLNHIVSTFSNSFNKSLKKETKQLMNEGLSNYYLIAISRRHSINIALNSFSFDKKDYSILIDTNKFLGLYSGVDYLKNENILREIAFQGELLRDSYLKDHEPQSSDVSFNVKLLII